MYIGIALLVFIALLIGLASGMQFERYRFLRQESSGMLRVAMTDDNEQPYIFLQAFDNPNELVAKGRVIFEVYEISQK